MRWGGCNNGEISNSSAGYVVSFLDGAGVKIDCNIPTWRSDVAKIKSEGTAGNTKRAVEVAIAAVDTGKYQTSCSVNTGDISGLSISYRMLCVRINTSTGDTKCQSARPDQPAATWNNCGAGDPWGASGAGDIGKYQISCSVTDSSFSESLLCVRTDTTTGNRECKYAAPTVSPMWVDCPAGNP